MIILYDQNTGKIYYSVYVQDWFRFRHTTNIPLSEYQIDEIDPENKILCGDLALYGNTWKVDINGLGKYYMQNDAGTWNLYKRDGWQEYIDV